MDGPQAEDSGGGRRRAPEARTSGARAGGGGPRGRRPLAPVWAWAMLLLLAVAVHLTVLYLPGEQVPEAGFQVPGLDKLVHVLAFGVPTFAAVVLGRSARWSLPFLLHAPVSEWAQASLAAQRSGDPWDVVADVVGVLLGVLAGRRLLRRGLAAGRPAEYASRVPPARE
ncbi:VanZ family protein [Micrococcus lylae]|uniref:VanZ family protein n=1 Tax=Micrococcus lylae TaxID=1273 RepID=UPI003EB78907